MDAGEATGRRLTGYKSREGSQGDDSPEVIPPEHTLLETEGNPDDRDQAGHEEEAQGGVWITCQLVRAKQ